MRALGNDGETLSWLKGIISRLESMCPRSFTVLIRQLPGSNRPKVRPGLRRKTPRGRTSNASGRGGPCAYGAHAGLVEPHYKCSL